MNNPSETGNNFFLYLQELSKNNFGQWGISYLSPLQELIVHQILCAGGFYGTETALEEPKSRIVVFPTGFGKTFCFGIPVSLLPGPTMIVYPLRSLLFDQERRFKDAGLEPALLYGGQDQQERSTMIQKILSGSSKILVSTLEVLLSPQTINILANIQWSHLVFDEAHVIQQWGSTFRPSYDRVEYITSVLNPHQCSAFTATADKQILDRLREIFGTTVVNETKASPDKQNIEYRTFKSHDPGLSLEYILKGNTIPRIQFPCLVFIRNRSKCLQFCRQIHMGLGNRVKFYHAGLDHAEKKHIEHWFRHCPDGILVSTNAFGLGVDHPNIRTVLHWNLPDSMPSYVQEAGRAGRDGKSARAWVVQDVHHPPESSSLEQLLDNSQCRRKSILASFDTVADYCGTCDVCQNDVWLHPPEIQTIMRYVQKSPGIYTTTDLFRHIGESLGINNQNRFSGLINTLLAQDKLNLSKSPLTWKRLVMRGDTSPS